MRPKSSNTDRQMHRAPAARRRKNTSESGFTLAAVIVLATIVMIFAAYTIPRAWSTIMKRERERQTIYAMRQYAKAITEFRVKNSSFPTSPQQLKDQRSPRMIRGVKGEFVDALTGDVDWLLIPASAQNAIQPCVPAVTTNGPPGVPTPAQPLPTSDSGGAKPQAKPELAGIPIKDYAGGPFIGVRPATHGKALVTLCTADTYETWVYTANDYVAEKTGRIAGASAIFH